MTVTFVHADISTWNNVPILFPNDAKDEQQNQRCVRCRGTLAECRGRETCLAHAVAARGDALGAAVPRTCHMPGQSLVLSRRVVRAALARLLHRMCHRRVLCLQGTVPGCEIQVLF